MSDEREPIARRGERVVVGRGEGREPRDGVARSAEVAGAADVAIEGAERGRRPAADVRRARREAVRVGEVEPSPPMNATRRIVDRRSRRGRARSSARSVPSDPSESPRRSTSRAPVSFAIDATRLGDRAPERARVERARGVSVPTSQTRKPSSWRYGTRPARDSLPGPENRSSRRKRSGSMTTTGTSRLRARGAVDGK